MNNNEETINRRAKRRKVRKMRADRIERSWIDWAESFPPYRPGDLAPRRK